MKQPTLVQFTIVSNDTACQMVALNQSASVQNTNTKTIIKLMWYNCIKSVLQYWTQKIEKTTYIRKFRTKTKENKIIYHMKTRIWRKTDTKDLICNIDKIMKWTRKHKRSTSIMDLLVSGEFFGGDGRKVGNKLL